MRKRAWMGLVVAVAVIVIGSWSAARLMYGRPHWSSVAAIGQSQDRHGGFGRVAEPQPAGPPAENAPYPAGGGTAIPAPPAEGPGAWPGRARPDAGRGSRWADGGVLPPGHPPFGRMREPDSNSRAHRSAEFAMGGGPAAPAGPGAGDAASPVKDPVCGMSVQPAAAAATLTHNGKTYYFCSPECRDAFRQDPGKYR